MLSPHVVLAVACVAGDLAGGRPVSGHVERGDLAALTGAAGPRDGAAWDAAGAVVLGSDGWIVVDLGEPRAIRAIALQADDNDSYTIEGSLDGATWSELATAGRDWRGPGLRTRAKNVDGAVASRLRITGRGGDGMYSVGHVHVFCLPPPDWPGEPALLSPARLWRAIDDPTMTVIKGIVAGAGALLLLFGALRERLLRRARDLALAALGVLSFCCFFNLFHFHFENYVHYWDAYHYYVGAKYLPELGYTRLYECTTVAEAELYGRAAVSGRLMTDLASNEIVPAQPIVDEPTRCTRWFSRPRWAEFKSDVAFFRNIFAPAQWNKILKDHGYNATPVWGLAGRLLTALGPATRNQLFALDLVDSLLLALMWVAVAWAFGWRTACVGLLWWGTNYPARFFWNGGAFLRMDWLFWMVAGICFVRRGHPRAGGFALGYSALLRVFPGFLFVALLLQIAVTSWRERRLRVGPAARGILWGGAAAAVVLLPLALFYSGSGAAFVENSRKHLATPLTNSMGLKTVVAFTPATAARRTVDGSLTDPYRPWKAAKREAYAARRPLFFAGLAAFLALLGWAVARQPTGEAWAALALGAGLIPFAAELSCYYFSFLLVLAFLRSRWIGPVLAAASAATCVVPSLRWWDDETYLVMSFVVLALVVTVTCLTARKSS